MAKIQLHLQPTGNEIVRHITRPRISGGYSPKMKIEDANGRQIRTIDDWSMIYDKNGEKPHWQPGRSAYSAADFIMNHNGAERLRRRVEELLGEIVHFDSIVPALEQRFDTHGRGRMHDLGITGSTAARKSLFIGVEAKVDESFGTSSYMRPPGHSSQARMCPSYTLPYSRRSLSTK